MSGWVKCSNESCDKTAATGGFCLKHGGGARCQHPGCSKFGNVRAGGNCWDHAVGFKPSVGQEVGVGAGAAAGVSTNGGGGVGVGTVATGPRPLCQHPKGCNQYAATGAMYCWGHVDAKPARPQCELEGCVKQALQCGYCSKHSKKCMGRGLSHGKCKRRIPPDDKYCPAHGGDAWNSDESSDDSFESKDLNDSEESDDFRSEDEDASDYEREPASKRRREVRPNRDAAPPLAPVYPAPAPAPAPAPLASAIEAGSDSGSEEDD